MPGHYRKINRNALGNFGNGTRPAAFDQARKQPISRAIAQRLKELGGEQRIDWSAARAALLPYRGQMFAHLSRYAQIVQSAPEGRNGL